MTTYMQQQQQLQSTRYGVAVGLFKGKEVYLSRRSEKLIFGKKWQFINGRMKGAEVSREGALRLVEEQAGLKITSDRLHDVGSISIDQTGEFYYVYLVHLNEGECPSYMEEKRRGRWRLVAMEASIVWDLVPGIRNILRGLNRCLKKLETETNLTPAEMEEANKIYDEQRKREEQNEAFASTDYGC